MAQPEVVSPLLSDSRSLREKAVSLQGRRGLNEETTKAALIIPLLTALGWDTLDPEQVVYEYKRRPKDLPVDFALLLQRTPSLFVEAKSLGHDITDRKGTTRSWEGVEGGGPGVPAARRRSSKVPARGSGDGGGAPGETTVLTVNLR